MLLYLSANFYCRFCPHFIQYSSTFKELRFIQTGGKDMSGTLPAKCFLMQRKVKRSQRAAGIYSRRKN
jgi:hypothetical protein